MMSILSAQIRLFLRKPWIFLSMTILCILLALLFSGMNVKNIEVPVYSELPKTKTEKILNELEKSDLFTFVQKNENEVKKLVRDGKVEAGLKLEKDDFRLIISAETTNVPILQQYVRKVYAKELQKENIIDHTNNNVTDVINNTEKNPLFSLHKKSFRSENTLVINTQLQSIFGFSLFFVIYTIAYNVLNILLEKREGIWDRLILSPLKKWEMYAGHLIYGFITGYIQVSLIFLTFHYLVGVDFNGHISTTLLVLCPYVFAIVAISIFLISIVKNIQQFNAILPLIAVSMAMIGGAYWPIEIVSSKILLFLAKFVPITYGMDLLKGVVIYNHSLADLFYPITVLSLIGIVFTGLGIVIMERKTA